MEQVVVIGVLGVLYGVLAGMAQESTPWDLRSAAPGVEQQCSLNSAGHLRKDRSGVRSNHIDHSKDDHQDDCEHNGVLGDVLPLVVSASPD